MEMAWMCEDCIRSGGEGEDRLKVVSLKGEILVQEMKCEKCLEMEMCVLVKDGTE